MELFLALFIIALVFGLLVEGFKRILLSSSNKSEGNSIVPPKENDND